MGTRKRIGLLVGQAEENYQKLFIEGFLKQAFSYDYDACVFAMYQKYQETTAREIGESTIFTLINYELFDAFVVLLDTIQTPGVADDVENQLKTHFNGPVICIDKESKYFPVVMTDHYSAVKKLIAHLIDEHGYRDIAYLTGKKWHLHSKERLQAYIDCMEEHSLPVREDRIFYGDFWYSSGEAMVDKLLKNRDNMPRAIACANDCMAIGVAKALENNGIHIPEEVAVVGYDSTEEGKTSPKPITSAPISAKECGVHAAICIKALFEGEPMPEFHAEVELFIGSSCGCHNDSVVPKLNLRENWSTDISEYSFYSCYNHMMEDMLSKSQFKDLMNTIFTYVYQIREFESFHLCLNSQWSDPSKLGARESQWQGYTDKMLPVLQCGRAGSNQNRINFDKMFDCKILLPALYEERDVPMAFFFTPMHFEERCLGYAVISYGNEAKSYDDTYRLWLRNTMQGLECFRRIEALQQSNQLLQSSQIRDSLTGLYNYQGLLQQVKNYYGHYVSVIAIDIKGLAGINGQYGREEGNKAIRTTADILKSCVKSGISCRLGNGEFVGVILSHDNNKKQVYKIKNNLLERLQSIEGFNYELAVYVGCEVGEVSSREGFEHLLNSAVGQKNGNKINERKMQNGDILTEEEQKEAAVVQAILDENRFHYHFQPIVSAKTGEIYAYEALMRADVTPYLSPLKILKYAEHMNRLYDVEKSTFFNIIDNISSKQELFEGKKVFINSIPGQRLQGDDAVVFEEKIREHTGSVVVELTEQTELSDDELATMKEIYAKMGIDTAVDDYGTGYSNVTNLLRYMPNYVKIDRMLLSEIQDSPQKQHFVREIIEFAHDNNIQALAEGVETTEELQTVIRLGVDLIQGYYTAKPAQEVAMTISKDVKEEIVQYQQQKASNKDSLVYVAGKESRISLAKLVADQYASIEVVNDKTTYRDVTISGVPGLTTQIALDIRDGYQGRIVLDNINFSGKKRRTCIDIGENCEVTLVLQGENQLCDGGIRVPESSKLIIEGDGNLDISINYDGYFGIGNDVNAGHGTIDFVQDGCVEISGSGSCGVGIGSGLGGEILIHRGKYVLNMSGKESVGIGSINGGISILAAYCNINVNFATTRCVAFGSMTGDVQVHVSYAMVKGIFGGDDCVGLGCMEDGSVNAIVDNATLNLNLRAKYMLCGIGSKTGATRINICHAAVIMKVDGQDGLAMGNRNCSAKIDISKSNVNINVKSDLDIDLGAADSDIHIEDSPYSFILNGVEKNRIVEDA